MFLIQCMRQRRQLSWFLNIWSIKGNEGRADIRSDSFAQNVSFKSTMLCPWKSGTGAGKVMADGSVFSVSLAMTSNLWFTLRLQWNARELAQSVSTGENKSYRLGLTVPQTSGELLRKPIKRWCFKALWCCVPRLVATSSFGRVKLWGKLYCVRSPNSVSFSFFVKWNIINSTWRHPQSRTFIKELKCGSELFSCFSGI